MGILVSATEAARLVDRSERIVRDHIYRGDLAAEKAVGQGRAPVWRIDVEQLTLIPGWRVDRDRLAQLEMGKRSALAGPTGLLARMDHLERQVRALIDLFETQRAEMRSLDTARQEVIGMIAAIETGETGETAETSEEPPAPLGYRGPSTVTLRDRGPLAPREFATLADAARWLERHGVNVNTPKSWPGWRHVERTPAAALMFALALQQEAQRQRNWRVAWRLRRCADASCVCQEALEPVQ